MPRKPEPPPYPGGGGGHLTLLARPHALCPTRVPHRAFVYAATTALSRQLQCSSSKLGALSAHTSDDGADGPLVSGLVLRMLPLLDHTAVDATVSGRGPALVLSWLHTAAFKTSLNGAYPTPILLFSLRSSFSVGDAQIDH